MEVNFLTVFIWIETWKNSKTYLTKHNTGKKLQSIFYQQQNNKFGTRQNQAVNNSHLRLTFTLKACGDFGQAK